MSRFEELKDFLYFVVEIEGKDEALRLIEVNERYGKLSWNDAEVLRSSVEKHK